jgi:hypothetical protein
MELQLEFLQSWGVFVGAIMFTEMPMLMGLKTTK